VLQDHFMPKRRNIHPAMRMPATLPREAWLVVLDDHGVVLRIEQLAAGTDLPSRLAAASTEYTAQGWVGKPSPGRWSFIVRKGRQSLAIGIRASRPGASSGR
jgi:hypothetical protein